MAKLKVAGTWAGVVEVELEKWTVSMLREEVAKRSNCAPDAINLICAGKVLKDGHGTENLSELGIRNNSKILSSRVSVENAKSLRDEALAEEDRSRRLARVKAAATALAKRHANGSMPVEDFNIELEDQSGKKVNLGSETDQRAVMMGLMLHANGKQLIRKQKYADALEVLAMGEESFSLCDPKVIEMVDNVPILQIDMVWCYFMLRDISSLSLAGVRLCKAREGIERAHGKDYSRVRLLQGGRYPEIALHLRLELLEGVVAYHSGHFDQSRNALTSAQAKFFKLQVPDEALCQVISMGFQKHDAMRALRMNNQDVGGAVDFLVEEKAKRLRKREEDSKRQQEIMEQKSYGVTPLEKAVDLQRLNELVSIGYEKALAAEALRRNENDTQKALDDLTNPETNASIQNDIESRKRKRQRKAEDNVIKQLLSMGFDRSRVEEAVRAGGTVEGAMQLLISESMPNQPSDANVSSTSASAVDNTDPADANTIDYAGDISTDVGLDDRDIEMEGEIADELSNTDAFSDYDIDVMKEGEAIEEYLALLASADSSN